MIVAPSKPIIGDGFLSLHSFPLVQTGIGMYICYEYIGSYSFIGLAILCLFIPFNSLTGRIFLKVRTKVASLSDTRIRLVNEIIKVSKYQQTRLIFQPT